MPEVTKQASASGAKTNYTTGMASMLGNYEALGYICMGILAFALGVCVTILLYRLRKAEEHRKKAEEYKTIAAGARKQAEKRITITKRGKIE